MNKSELVDAVADAADLSKADSARALDAVIGAISDALKSGDQVSVVGFGTFLVRQRAARTGRNPQTGAEIQIAIQFTYPTAHALLFSGLSANSSLEASIAGSDGTIIIHSRWHESQGISVTKGIKTERISLPTVGKGYTYEIEEVHRCLLDKKIESSLWSHTNSLELIGLLDKIRAKAGITFPFE